MKNFSQFGTILTREESKKIRGGSTCIAQSSTSEGRYECSSSASVAEGQAGGGWWCCNCEFAIVHC